MSASLVGSEMCIRDRRKDPKNRIRRASGPWGSARAQGSAPDRSESVGAVSYTHLTLPTICSV
eukprot:14169348-Alexandrium_andersonii.AAC.1